MTCHFLFNDLIRLAMRRGELSDRHFLTDFAGSMLHSVDKKDTPNRTRDPR